MKNKYQFLVTANAYVDQRFSDLAGVLDHASSVYRQSGKLPCVELETIKRKRNPMIAPSVKALCETFRMDEETAKRIRWAWKNAEVKDLRPIIEKKYKLHHGFIETRNYGAKLAIDVIADFHGVEYLGRHKRRHYIDVDYLNAGDCYAPTLVFAGLTMFISTVGDLIEKGYIKETRT